MLLTDYKAAMQKELSSILDFWMQHTIDKKNGGFTGQIDFNNQINATAAKGSVLNARILWSFAAAYNLTGNKLYLQNAERAYRYICNYFIDKEQGGVYWTVDYQGKPLDTKKQVYAIAFTVYAFSEYYKAVKEPAVIQNAINLYDSIIQHSYDKTKGGYIEAFTREWKPIEDLRLSVKDANEKKTMNTHLHVLEAFTNLYRIWPYEQLKNKIKELVKDFLQHIINPATNTQHLFFDEDWRPKSKTISYGHDIEAAWLLQEAAEIIDDANLIKTVRKKAVAMTDAVAEGLDADGGLWYEYEPTKRRLIKEKHMWPQAEAMVGFFNAWQNTGNKLYLQQSTASWQFVQQHIHDKQNGEWYWGVKENYDPMQKDKVGIWKCPYHNSRACIEIIKRIEETENNKN
jgi:cellobiose epimerase